MLNQLRYQCIYLSHIGLVLKLGGQGFPQFSICEQKHLNDHYLRSKTAKVKDSKLSSRDLSGLSQSSSLRPSITRPSKNRKMANFKKYIDIGANLTDSMYEGTYNGNKKHEEDLSFVMNRASNVGIDKMIITGTSLTDSEKAIKLSKKHDNLFCTVGCHPTRCGEFEEHESSPEDYLEALIKLTLDNRDKVIAVGECGLDYDRLHFCSADLQKKYFEKQISIAEVTGLPMFLHCRKAASDLVAILSGYRERITGGVVHSFDGTQDELKEILELDLFIGINGCSLKTEENLSAAAQIPTNRLLIETDCPWCEIRPSHASFKHVKTKFPSKKKEKWTNEESVKGRNEPQSIVQVLEVLSAIRKQDELELSEAIYQNTKNLFFKS